MSLMRFAIGDSCQLEFLISKEDVQKFGDLSGDQNPIHMDEDYAKKSSAAGRVVHGALLSAYVSNLIGMHLPSRHGPDATGRGSVTPPA